jgi:hypothetical protein
VLLEVEGQTCLLAAGEARAVPLRSTELQPAAQAAAAATD